VSSGGEGCDIGRCGSTRRCWRHRLRRDGGRGAGGCCWRFGLFGLFLKAFCWWWLAVVKFGWAFLTAAVTSAEAAREASCVSARTCSSSWCSSSWSERAEL